MTPNELYKMLDDAGLDWECREVFEDLRVINIVVIEDPENDIFSDEDKAMSNSVRMRDDLAKQGLLIPAGLSHSNYDELENVTHLTADDLIGAVQYDTGEDPDSHAFCPVKLIDGTIVYMMAVDLDLGSEHD